MGIAKQIFPQFFSAFLMFPFRLGSDSQKNQQKREEIVELFKNSQIWQYQPYSIQTGFDYNEYVYFYPYIWDILFTGQSDYEDRRNIGVNFFQMKKNEWKNARIEVIPGGGNSAAKMISLPLKNIFLHLFHQSSIGILVFELLHSEYPEQSKNSGKIIKGSVKQPTYSIQDFLQFLNYARRIYPPFVAATSIARREGNRIKFQNIDTVEEKILLTEDGVAVSKDAIQSSEYAQEVHLIFNENWEIKSKSNGILYVPEDKGKTYRPVLSPIVTKLLDTEGFCYENDDYAPIIDDRMFIHSFYSIDPNAEYRNEITGDQIDYPRYWNHYFINNLKMKFHNDFSANTLDEVSDLWYQMIFIDWQWPSCQNRLMQSDILRNSSYGRWSDWGTFYGFSRFSSVTLTNINEAPFLYNHFQSLYYQIAVLLLFYRGALLNFSDRCEKLSSKLHELKGAGGSDPELRGVLKDVENLHKDFLLFRNRYWFREVTAQDQGIEIFDIWSQQLRNKELMEDVQSEIKELFNYVDTTYEKTISRAVNILTALGAIFFPLAIITSLFGINAKFANLFFEFPPWEIPLISILWSFLIFLALFYMTYQIMRHFFKKFLKEEKFEPPELKELFQESVNALRRRKEK